MKEEGLRRGEVMNITYGRANKQALLSYKECTYIGMENVPVDKNL